MYEMVTEQIIDMIRKEYADGSTQTSLAKKYGCAQSYINALLSGKRTAGGMTLKQIEKMFPESYIVFYNSPTINQTAHHAKIISQKAGDDAGRIEAAKAVLASASMTDAEKIKALKPILGTE